MSNTGVRITESLFQKLQEEIAGKDARIAELEKELAARGKEVHEQPEYNFKAKVARFIDNTLNKPYRSAPGEYHLMMQMFQLFSGSELKSYVPESSLRSSDTKES